MKISTRELKELLIEELENKKPFSANFPFDCALCGESVEEDEEFFFFGNKKRVCSDCRSEMESAVETIV